MCKSGLEWRGDRYFRVTPSLRVLWDIKMSFIGFRCTENCCREFNFVLLLDMHSAKQFNVDDIPTERKWMMDSAKITVIPKDNLGSA